MARKNETPIQERLNAAREAEREEKREMAAHQKAERAAEAVIEKARRDWEEHNKSAGVLPVNFGTYPSIADARDRDHALRQARDARRMSEERLARLAERRAALEKAAAPLSDAARKRLAELIAWADADAELAERLGGTSPLALLGNGQADRLRALADAHGVDR